MTQALNRAYSFLECKAMDDGRRVFSGLATTPEVDRVGDVIDPMGVDFKNPMVLLHQHNHDAPIGKVTFGRPTKAGIPFEAEIAVVGDEFPDLKARVDTAWGELKHGLVRAVSIGFRPIEYSFIDTGVHYQKIEVFELSTVSIPANAGALITAVKSLDASARAAAGVPDPELPQPPEPAATGNPARVVRWKDTARVRAPFVISKIHR
jgi:HK97 family phage prohead protease